MKVRLQMSSSPPLDFNFHSGRSSPSTPKPFADNFLFLSAPTSPTRFSDLNQELENDFYLADRSSAADDDFAFHASSSEVQTPSASADELFDGGRIRSHNNPADTHSSRRVISPPPLSSSKSKGDKSFWSQFTTRWKKQSLEKTEQLRGRNRDSTHGSRGARSLSPIRVSKYPWEDNTKPSTALTLSANSKSSKRWKLKDLLLFRSASEGRAADKDPLRKLTALYSSQQQSKSSRRGKVSAHERHYAMNKAVSNDMKKRTFLPYKQGIIGSFHGLGGY